MTATNRGDFLLGLLIGAAAGAAAALLYAPAPGSETREQVKHAASDAVDKAGEVASTVRDRAADVTSNVTSKAQGIASTVKDRAADMTSKAQDVASTVKDRAADMASKMKSQAQDMAAGVSDMKDQAVNTAQTAIAGAGGSSGSPGDQSGNGNAGGDWTAQLPEAAGTETHPRMDQHTLQVSDDPQVATERVTAAMQGSGDEARDIAEELAQAPVGRRSEQVAPSLES